MAHNAGAARISLLPFFKLYMCRLFFMPETNPVRAGDTVMEYCWSHRQFMMSNEYCRLLRLPDVIHMCGLSRTTLYRRMSEGLFPAPVRIGPRSVAWRESDVREWIEDRPEVSR